MGKIDATLVVDADYQPAPMSLLDGAPTSVDVLAYSFSIGQSTRRACYSVRMDASLRAAARRAGLQIQAGRLRGDALFHDIMSVPPRERDAWVDEALGFDAPPDDVPDLPRGAVPYLPCGVDTILRVAKEAPVREGDVFVDLGAGLGRVAVLVNLLCGAHAIGVECQRPLVARAQAIARSLGLDDVTTGLGDVTSADLADGDVFFTYASFDARVLANVLARLAEIARKKRIVVCAVGFDIHDGRWLRARPSSTPELTFYDSLFTAP